jgi:thioredoxin-like negative regulator of GroEL
MIKVKNIVFLFFLGLFSAMSARAAEEQSGIPWLIGTGKAMDEARESGRPIIVDLWAVWCEPCKLMEKTTFRDNKVLEALAGFVPLKVDADADTLFVERYDITIFPTLLFMDENGVELSRLTGYVEVAPLRARLKAVGGGYASYVENSKKRKDPLALKAVAAYLLEVGNPDEAVKLLRRAAKLSKGVDEAGLEELELALAEAQLSCGHAAGAAKEFERLADGATCPESRGRALVGLVRAERERGREEQAFAALTRLRREFPELAEQLE